MFGQAVGPVIGGALTEYGGFRLVNRRTRALFTY
jgi:hypothetical protein